MMNETQRALMQPLVKVHAQQSGYRVHKSCDSLMHMVHKTFDEGIQAQHALLHHSSYGASARFLVMPMSSNTASTPTKKQPFVSASHSHGASCRIMC
jgi:hypothetical protein